MSLRAAVGVAVLVAGVALAGAPKAKAPAKKKPAAGARKDGGAALEFGTVEIKIKGTATVYLDGKDLGPPPFKPVKVLAGKHQLRLVNEAMRIDQTQELEVLPQQISTLEFSFQ